MNLSSLTTLLKKLPLSFSKQASFHPQRDWLLLVGLGLFALIVLLIMQTIAFWQTLEEEDRVTLTEQEETKGTTDVLRPLFEKREAEQIRYDTEYRFIDPSR